MQTKQTVNLFIVMMLVLSVKTATNRRGFVSGAKEGVGSCDTFFKIDLRLFKKITLLTRYKESVPRYIN